MNSLLILATAFDVGKNTIFFANFGWYVSPFKAQNVLNNSSIIEGRGISPGTILLSSHYFIFNANPALQKKTLSQA